MYTLYVHWLPLECTIKLTTCIRFFATKVFGLGKRIPSKKGGGGILKSDRPKIYRQKPLSRARGPAAYDSERGRLSCLMLSWGRWRRWRRGSFFLFIFFSSLGSPSESALELVSERWWSVVFANERPLETPVRPLNFLSRPIS